MVLLASLIAVVAGARFSRPDSTIWKLAWSDEFNGANGSLPDSSKWSIETGGNGGGNEELQTYTNRTENVQQRNGYLVITARKESFRGPDKIERDYTSARLQTKGKFQVAYGRFEVSMQLPSGKGMWSAFWLLGNNVDKVGWPKCGEIDVAENIGDPRVIYSTLHGPGYSGGKGPSTRYLLPARASVNSAFHRYSLEWSPKELQFYFDDNLIAERTPDSLPPGTYWIYDHPFFLLLNLAIGGIWPGSPDEKTIFPQSMMIDYVRVYVRKSR